jgi:hypothetical protein
MCITFYVNSLQVNWGPLARQHSCILTCLSVHGEKTTALGSIWPKLTQRLHHHHRCLDTARYANLTSHLCYDFITVLTVHLNMKWHHNIKIVYRETPICKFLPITYDNLQYMLCKSMKFVAPWRWLYPAAKPCTSNKWIINIVQQVGSERLCILDSCMKNVKHYKSLKLFKFALVYVCSHRTKQYPTCCVLQTFYQNNE